MDPGNDTQTDIPEWMQKEKFCEEQIEQFVYAAFAALFMIFAVFVSICVLMVWLVSSLVTGLRRRLDGYTQFKREKEERKRQEVEQQSWRSYFDRVCSGNHSGQVGDAPDEVRQGHADLKGGGPSPVKNRRLEVHPRKMKYRHARISRRKTRTPGALPLDSFLTGVTIPGMETMPMEKLSKADYVKPEIPGEGIYEDMYAVDSKDLLPENEYLHPITRVQLEAQMRQDVQTEQEVARVFGAQAGEDLTRLGYRRSDIDKISEL